MKRVLITLILAVLTLSAITYKDIPRVKGAMFKYDDMEDVLEISVYFPFLNLDISTNLTTYVWFESNQITHHATFLTFWTIDKEWYNRSYDHTLKFLINDTLRLKTEADGSFDYAAFLLTPEVVHTIAIASTVKYSVSGMDILFNERKFTPNQFKAFQKMDTQLEILDSLTTS